MSFPIQEVLFWPWTSNADSNVCLEVFQQISGINLITYYAATIYQQEIGLNGLTSRALAAANGTGMIMLTLTLTLSFDD